MHAGIPCGNIARSNKKSRTLNGTLADVARVIDTFFASIAWHDTERMVKYSIHCYGARQWSWRDAPALATHLLAPLSIASACCNCAYRPQDDGDNGSGATAWSASATPGSTTLSSKTRTHGPKTNGRQHNGGRRPQTTTGRQQRKRRRRTNECT